MAETVKWGRGRRAEFVDWFHNQLQHALNDRLNLERQWADHIEAYVAPRPASSDFPWPGATSEEFPLTAIHAEPVYSDFMQSIHAPSNLWTAIARAPEWVDYANPLTEFLRILDERFLRMRNVNERAFLDLVILGTAIYKHGWDFERRPKKKFDDQLNIVSDIELINQPFVRHVPLNDFVWPANAWDVDPDAAIGPAEWVAERFRLTPNQLKARAKGQEPFLPNYDPRAVDAVIDRETNLDDDKVREKIRDTDRLDPSFDWKIKLYEAWCRFDVDGNGVDEDIVVIWHHEGGGTILRAIHNPFLHGKRPFEVGRYFPGFGLTGMGIAQMSEWAQATASKFLCATADNVLLSNTIMYGVPQGSMVQADEPIYPGKVWPLAPGEQVQEIQLGTVRPDIFQFLGMLQQWSEQRTGISELRQGNITGLPSRTPATTILSLLREGNKRFDMILGNLRKRLGNIGARTVQNVVQMSRSQQKWRELALKSLGPEDGARVAEILALPLEAIEEGVGIEVTATSGQVNREIEKQTFIGLAQFMGQAYPQLIQAAQLMGDQNLTAQTALASYNGGIELLRRLLEAFEIQNPERYLPQPVGPGAGANGAQPGGGVAAPQQPLDPSILRQFLGFG